VLWIAILAVLLFIGYSVLRDGGAATIVEHVQATAQVIYQTATSVPGSAARQPAPPAPAVQQPVVVQPQGMPELPHVEPTPEVVRVVVWGAGGGGGGAFNANLPATVTSVPTSTPWPTPTPLPEPGQPGFVESFQSAQCSPLIGYLPGHPCYGKVPTLVPTPSSLPQPGEDGFVESFK